MECEESTKEPLKDVTATCENFNESVQLGVDSGVVVHLEQNTNSNGQGEAQSIRNEPTQTELVDPKGNSQAFDFGKLLVERSNKSKGTISKNHSELLPTDQERAEMLPLATESASIIMKLPFKESDQRKNVSPQSARSKARALKQTPRSGKPPPGKDRRTVNQNNRQMECEVQHTEEQNDVETAPVSKEKHFKGDVAEGMEHLYRTHICPECRRCFKKRTHLVEHMHLHFPDPSLQCPNCQRFFTSKSKLHVHLLREAGQKSHRCHLCDYSAVERNSLKRHLASMHEDETNFYSDLYPCPSCGETFRLSHALKEHMKSHHTLPEEKSLVCFQQDCIFETQDKKEFQKHLKDVHKLKAIECRHHACSALFKTKDEMEVHHRTHAAFHCPHCDFTCSNKHTYRKHKRQGHPGSEELCCSFCPFSSFNPVEFTEHVGRLHANEKTHTCPDCGFATAHKRVLGRHRLLHTGEKPHKCRLCDFSCRDVSYLSKHMLTHSSDKNYMCSECGYITKWKHYLNVHMRKHIGDLRYQCNECSYRCHRADQLSSHKLRHQDKTLICEVCAFACKRKYELRKHMRVKHSQGNTHQTPFHQCQYCSYRTHYRQALLNHENCKHTRQREFSCALCAYRTFSNTSLFLHKRKVHGYVPGDKAWLENYARHEMNNNTPDIFLRYSEKHDSPVKLMKSTDDHLLNSNIVDTECAVDSGTSENLPDQEQQIGVGCIEEFKTKSLEMHESQTKLCSEESPQICDSATSNQVWPSETCQTVESCQEIVVTDKTVLEVPSDNQIECYSIVMTPISTVQLDTDNFTMDKEGSKTLLTVSGAVEYQSEDIKIASISEINQNEELEEEEMEVVPETEHEDQCDASQGGVFTLEVELKQTAVEKNKVNMDGSPQCLSGSHTCDMEEMEGVVDINLDSSKDPSAMGKGQEESNHLQSDCLIKALRKQDKEQAEALVLEGRVQMLVVQTRSAIFRCDRCTYVTRKQSSLILHCQSACRARKVTFNCEECGAIFKQQRGLDSHRLRKCPAHSRRGKRLTRLTPTSSEKSIADDNCTAVLSAETEMEAIQLDVGLIKPGTVGNRKVKATEDKGEHSALTSFMPQTNVNQEQETNTEQKTLRTANAARNTVFSVRKKVTMDSSDFKNKMKNSVMYHQEGKKFKCSRCSFVCSRQSAIERHFSTFPHQTFTETMLHRGLEASKKRQVPQDAGNILGDGTGSEEEEDNEKNKTTKKNRRFSCRSCSFTCHQKRALESHVKRGCLKPNEIQCQLCSFVGKSKVSLLRHRELHSKKKHQPVVGGKKPLLCCEQCPFTCKQTRCLLQHVALKHEGLKPHRCQFCDFSTTRRYRLEAHESLHTGIGRICCEQCGQTFGTNSKLRLHHQRVHEKRPTHFCQLCDYSGYNGNDISRHTLSCHTGDLLHTCTECSAKFSSETALKQHSQRKHQKSTSLTCTQCSFSCHSQVTLKCHLQRKHPQLQCSTCQASFETREDLEEHRKTHFSQRCPLCPFAARERQLLAQHLLENHENGPLTEKPLKCAACEFACSHQLVFEQHVRSHGGTRLYKCNDCQYTTRNRQKITWHMRIHTGEKPYQCSQCSYACADPSRLKYHMRTHQEERKYLCPECGYKCKWVNQLKYHMTKHTGAKPYECEECDYCTNRADALRIHRETRHREARSFICEQCGKGFKTRFLLKTHMKKHSDDRPYVCRVCLRGFRWAAGLRHHYLTHTKQHPFYCLHCSYRAKQRFQVVKHLQRHHPEMIDGKDPQEGVGKDPGSQLVLQQARLKVAKDTAGPEAQEHELMHDGKG
ncbi:zinc finger protein 142 [Erpetoichthys calabaricus]|uniref:Zinc finger protein 142 n=1 Tax=Erpetoichthys calabaricus TaxID=27687 RepID=A0A8C4TC28_ERPCA|nr:zinc finger protein 142 [Erpetoichthys calabaricus]